MFFMLTAVLRMADINNRWPHLVLFAFRTLRSISSSADSNFRGSKMQTPRLETLIFYFSKEATEYLPT